MGNVNEWVQGAAPGASALRLNQPFHLKTATYNGGTTAIDTTIGAGRADFSNPSGGKLGVIAEGTDVTLSITSPVASTTYYVFIRPTDGALSGGSVAHPGGNVGSFRVSTSGTPQAGEARIGSVTTANPVSNPPTRADLRGMLPVPSSSLTTDVNDIKPVGTRTLGTSAMGSPADHIHAQESNVAFKDNTLQTNLDADKLDGRHAGHASGDIPIADGTVVTNLNADKVDSYDVGHSTGQVPLADGTVVSTLNADLLDGSHAGTGNGLNVDQVDGYHVGASGIPIRDGNVQSSLNADMTDGIHAAAGTVGGVLVVGATKSATTEPRTIYTAQSRPAADAGVLEGDILVNG